MRKEADYLVTDHIRIYVTGNAHIEELAVRNGASIMGDTLANSLENKEAPEGAYAKQWDINGENVTIAVEKIG